ncbi:hypothetical protein NDU88_002905 [Pleurodeles waltl]|uniref:Uncharacterized protein n=1 Tax=Pleurodeles waltl TaxID=8319 RepID=A0AAV7UEL0_PLEWA|nr:hypothetical protein NDU88_002905 [Pleurodeles waltl]
MYHQCRRLSQGMPPCRPLRPHSYEVTFLAPPTTLIRDLSACQWGLSYCTDASQTLPLDLHPPCVSPAILKFTALPSARAAGPTAVSDEATSSNLSRNTTIRSAPRPRQLCRRPWVPLPFCSRVRGALLPAVPLQTRLLEKRSGVSYATGSHVPLKRQ